MFGYFSSNPSTSASTGGSFTYQRSSVTSSCGTVVETSEASTSPSPLDPVAVHAANDRLAQAPTAIVATDARLLFALMTSPPTSSQRVRLCGRFGRYPPL